MPCVLLMLLLDVAASAREVVRPQEGAARSRGEQRQALRAEASLDRTRPRARKRNNLQQRRRRATENHSFASRQATQQMCVSESTNTSDSIYTRLRRPFRATDEGRCVFVDIGAHTGDSIRAFVKGGSVGGGNKGQLDSFGTRYKLFVGNNGFPVSASRCTKHSALPSSMHSGPACRCPHQAGRRNVDVYGLEASPVRDKELTNLFCQHPNILGMYKSLAISNETKREGVSFYTANQRSAMVSTLDPAMAGRSDFTRVTVPQIDVCEFLLKELKLEPRHHVVRQRRPSA